MHAHSILRNGGKPLVWSSYLPEVLQRIVLHQRRTDCNVLNVIRWRVGRVEGELLELALQVMPIHNVGKERKVTVCASNQTMRYARVVEQANMLHHVVRVAAVIHVADQLFQAISITLQSGP